MKKAWGRGYATEVAAAIRDHALGQLGCGRLIALINPANVASERVAVKIGLKLTLNFWGGTYFELLDEPPTAKPGKNSIIQSVNSYLTTRYVVLPVTHEGGIPHLGTSACRWCRQAMLPHR